MQKMLLLGDEALAQGAIDAGLSGCYAYPGTPSTEIMEYVQRHPMTRKRMIQSTWSTNEKTAMEAALGMSYAGKRSLVCMKHVGLNVAADAFINAAITGVNGGMVVAVADDPSMHSSQNEQDSRFYGKFAMIPVFEPSNQQEVYDMTMEAFEMSEKYGIPVMIRLTTRLAHSRSGIQTREPREPNAVKLPSDPRQFILLPAIARKRYKSLLSYQGSFEEASEQSSWNHLENGSDPSLGVIACGLSYNYLMENAVAHNLDYPILKINQYPVPVSKIRKLADQCEQLLVLEEGYPLLEEMLRGVLENKYTIRGRLDGTLPRDGELNADLVGNALGIDMKKSLDAPPIVTSRPPALCPGCGHSDVFLALNEALDEFGITTSGRVFSDIGCYTLGALAPYGSIDTCVDMGASVTMAVGAADAGLVPSIAVIGDSTFTHSGMTGLLDAVVKNSPITVIISDNSTTAMTGGQNSAGTGFLEKICLGLGVAPEHIHQLTPLKKFHRDNVDVMKKEFAYEGVSVILARRECIQTAAKRKRKTTGAKKT
jgi:indolepyruvate ferredoxin oxidoreductase alpha subunit